MKKRANVANVQTWKQEREKSRPLWNLQKGEIPQCNARTDEGDAKTLTFMLHYSMNNFYAGK
jgi:hypothetical protein